MNLFAVSPEKKAAAVSPDPYQASRADKLRAIEALGLDPWGGRFDGHSPIADVLKLPAELPEGQRPHVKVAGRVVLRRDSGKVHWVDLWDWTTPLRDGDRGKLQVMIGQKQVGEQGWQLAQNFDL